MRDSQLIQLEENPQRQQHPAPGPPPALHQVDDTGDDRNHRPELQQLSRVQHSHVIEQQHQPDQHQHSAGGQSAPVSGAAAAPSPAYPSAYEDPALNAVMSLVADLLLHFADLVLDLLPHPFALVIPNHFCLLAVP